MRIKQYKAYRFEELSNDNEWEYLENGTID